MKNVLLAILLGGMIPALVNCKKSDIDPPDQPNNTCKALVIDRGNGQKHTYEYNNAGFISKMTIDLQKSTGSNPHDVYVYTFSYAAGNPNQPTGATITVNGTKPTRITDRGIGDAVSFIWTGNRLTRIEDKVANKPFLTTSLTYDNQGRITTIDADADPQWTSSFETHYAYDLNGNYRVSEPDGQGGSYYEDVTIDPSVYHPGSLLGPRGLPFDLFNSLPWLNNIFTTIKGYEVSPAGKAELVTEYKLIHVVKNSHNIATAQTIEANGTQRMATAQLGDCD